MSKTIMILFLCFFATTSYAIENVHIGQVLTLKTEKTFYTFDQTIGENVEIKLPSGTQMRLDEVNETAASGDQVSYWNFILPTTGQRVWTIHNKLMAELKAVKPAVFAIVPGKSWAPACTNFFDENGNIGPWGQAIVNAFDDLAFRFLLDATKVADLTHLCPAYAQKEFDETSKKKFWAYFIASMSMSESSCGARRTARGPNGTAAGLLQLHLGKESAYGCDRINSFNPIANVTCGLTMLKNQVTKYGNLFVERGNTYWQVLWAGSRLANNVGARVAITRSCQESMRSMGMAQ